MFGEDVGDPEGGGVAGVSRGLSTKYGWARVRSTPIAEQAIVGAAIGSFVIGNPKAVLAKTGGALGQMIKGPRYSKDSYLELLGLMYAIFKIAKSKGMLTLEAPNQKAPMAWDTPDVDTPGTHLPYPYCARAAVA